VNGDIIISTVVNESLAFSRNINDLVNGQVLMTSFDLRKSLQNAMGAFYESNPPILLSYVCGNHYDFVSLPHV